MSDPTHLAKSPGQINYEAYYAGYTHVEWKDASQPTWVRAAMAVLEHDQAKRRAEFEAAAKERQEDPLLFEDQQ